MPAIRSQYPFEVDMIDPQWIVLADGTKIAATIWKPRTKRKVPVVVEMLPYRRRDAESSANSHNCQRGLRPR